MRIIIITRPDLATRRAIEKILSGIDEIQSDIKSIKRDIKDIKDVLKVDGQLIIELFGDNISVKGAHVMVDFKKVGQFVDFKVTILDAKGRPAAIDGDVVVANSDDTVGTVTYDQAARAGRLTCAGEGIGHVDLSCDADLGAGVKPLVGVIDYTGPNLSEASVFTVEVGEIQDPVV